MGELKFVKDNPDWCQIRKTDNYHLELYAKTFIKQIFLSIFKYGQRGIRVSRMIIAFKGEYLLQVIKTAEEVWLFWQV